MCWPNNQNKITIKQDAFNSFVRQSALKITEQEAAVPTNYPKRVRSEINHNMEQ